MESLQSGKLYTSCFHVQTTDTGNNHAPVTVGSHEVWGGRRAELGKTLPLSEAGALAGRRSVCRVLVVVVLSHRHLEHVVCSRFWFCQHIKIHLEFISNKTKQNHSIHHGIH